MSDLPSAPASGASVIVRDLKHEFVQDYVFR
jgi:hypothetical protein